MLSAASAATAEGQVLQALAAAPCVSRCVRAIVRGRLAAIGAAAVCVFAALYLTQQRREAGRVQAASEAGSAGEYGTALRLAGEVSDPPHDAEALRIRAYALIYLSRFAAASQAFGAAVARNPNDWVLHRDWAIVLRFLGKRSLSRREISRALALNPRMALPPGFIRAPRSARGGGPSPAPALGGAQQGAKGE